MVRSAVFIVPINQRLRGSLNGSSEYCRVIASPRYSSRKYSSPKTLAMLPRLISSMMSTNVRSGSWMARLAILSSGPGLNSKEGAPLA